MYELLCQSVYEIKLKKKQLAAVVICMLLFLAGHFVLQPVQITAAQKIIKPDQLENFLVQSIKKGKNTITFQSSDSFTANQIEKELQDAAKGQNMLLAGSIEIIRQTGNSGGYHYKIELSEDAFMKVRILKSESEAVKAAAKASKSGKYAANFYSEDAYAYGSPVNGTAVCQGYAAAFNLMAGKCGLRSMTV